MTWQTRLDHWSADIEATLTFGTGVIIQLAPWVMLVPTASLGYDSAVNVAGQTPVVGWCAALGIEGVGIAAIDTALRLWEHNAARYRGQEDADPPAPLGAAVGMVGLYFAAAVSMTLLLVGDGRHPVVLAYPVLALVAAGIRALGKDHARRLQAQAARAAARQTRDAEREAERLVAEQAQAEAKRAENREVRHDRNALKVELARIQASVQNVTESATVCTPEPVKARELSEPERAFLQFVQVNPYATYPVISKAVKRSPAWISDTVKRLKAEGVLHKNGNGFEVLADPPAS